MADEAAGGADDKATLPILADFVERAGWTAGQQFFAVLLATSSTATGVIDLPWQLAFVTSVGAGVATLVGTAAQYLARATDLGFWADQLLRLAKTFLSSLVGSGMAVAAGVLPSSWPAALDLAALATLSAFAKGLLARRQDDGGGRLTPSTLATSTYERAVAQRARRARGPSR